MAKKFKFRLQRVYEYRQLVKDEKLKELLLEKSRLQEILNKIEQLDIALSKNEILANKPLAVHEIELVGQYSKRLRGEIAHLKEQQEEQEKVVQEAEAAYIEAAREAESLENLKKKLKAKYMEYLDHQEAQFLDELVIQRTGFLKNAKE